jgi:hypothetical protein
METQGHKKHTVNITFLFISEGCKPIFPHLGNLKHCCFAGHRVLRPLSQFLGAFSQDMMPNHTDMVPLLTLTILYFEDPKNSTLKLLDTINNYSKVAGYKINTKNH